ncbi:DUF2690 domain-containing protein [Streptomyces sp. NPDC046985]|uniref:DUF2690 domain-containing protein n=1 Tax=Streptomyces sp. NPDC046985 TaxID=3155377 RepID=UPI003405A691
MRATRRARLAALAVAVIAVPTGLTVGNAGTASAAALASKGCGSACNATDPSQPVWSSQLGATVTCSDDAYTAKQSALKDGITLQLRYSPRCQTVWARFYGGSGSKNTYVASVYYDGWSPAFESMTELPSQPTGRNWSDQMDDAGVTAKACIGSRWTFLDDIGCTAGY